MKASRSGFCEHLGRKESNAQIERAFTVGERNGLRVGGIACMPARKGRFYLAAVTGAFSRKVVCWPMSERITEKVAIDAIGQAVGREGPPDDFSPTSDLHSSRATGSHDPAPLCCAAALLHLCSVLAPHLPRFCALAHSMISLIFGFRESCATGKPAIRSVTYGLLCVKYPLCVKRCFCCAGSMGVYKIFWRCAPAIRLRKAA